MVHHIIAENYGPSPSSTFALAKNAAAIADEHSPRAVRFRQRWWIFMDAGDIIGCIASNDFRGPVQGVRTPARPAVFVGHRSRDLHMREGVEPRVQVFGENYSPAADMRGVKTAFPDVLVNGGPTDGSGLYGLGDRKGELDIVSFVRLVRLHTRASYELTMDANLQLREWLG